MKGNDIFFNVNSPKYNKNMIIDQYNNNKLEYTFFWKTSYEILDEGCFSQWQESYFTVNNI